jgi:hypothetical protein
MGTIMASAKKEDEETAKEETKTFADTLLTAAKDYMLKQLLRSFEYPNEKSARQSEKRPDKEDIFIYKRFDQSCSCKIVQEIPVDEFEAFSRKLTKEFHLRDVIKESLIQGVVSNENEERHENFKQKDGKGNVDIGRFITMKRNGKIDIAYAIYTLSFELDEKETDEWCYEWRLYVVPVSWKYKKETPKLNEKQKKMFINRCKQNLYECVAQKCSASEK